MTNGTLVLGVRGPVSGKTGSKHDSKLAEGRKRGFYLILSWAPCSSDVSSCSRMSSVPCLRIQGLKEFRWITQFW